MFAGFCRGVALLPRRQGVPAPARSTAHTIEARYRGNNTDLSDIPQFKRHANDCGSTEVQIARLTARVEQLTEHLKVHRKDFTSRRGLSMILGQRRRMLRFLFEQNRSTYDKIIANLRVKPLKIQAGRGVMIKVTEEGKQNKVLSTDSPEVVN